MLVLCAVLLAFSVLILRGVKVQETRTPREDARFWADLKALSHMYQYAWRTGLKTTYYLRTLGASNIETATIDIKQREQVEPKKKEDTEAEKAACSIDAMLNGGTCEACQ